MQVSARGSEQRPPKTKTAEAAELIHKARKVLLGTSAAAAAVASTAAAETSAEAAAAAAAAAAAETAEVAEAETSSEPVAAVQKRSSKHEVFPRTNPRPPRSAQPHSRWEERQMLASALAESLALAEAVAATRGIIEASEAAEAAAQGSSSAPILGKRPLPPTGVAAAALARTRGRQCSATPPLLLLPLAWPLSRRSHQEEQERQERPPASLPSAWGRSGSRV